MRTIIIGSDFMYNSAGKLVPIEINTNSGISKSGIGHNSEFFILSGVTELIQSQNFTKLTYIGGLYSLNKQLVELCSSMGIVYEFYNVINSSSVPDIEDGDDHLIIRSSYDGLAIIDDMYCKNKTNFLNLIKSVPFGSEFAYMDSDGILVNNISTIRDNGNNPNFILKSVYPPYNKTEYPKLFKVSTQNELDVLLQRIDDEYFLMEYHFNKDMLYEGQISILRSFNLLYPPNLVSIPLGVYTLLSGKKLDDLSEFDPNTFELSPDDKLKYLVGDSSVHLPKLDDNDEVQMADGTFKSAPDLEVGDMLRTIDIANPHETDISSPCNDFKIDYETFVDDTTYSINKLVAKTRVNKVVDYAVMTFADGTTWRDTLSSAYLVLRDDNVRFAILLTEAVDCGIKIGDSIILIDTSYETLTTVTKEIVSIDVVKKIFGGWEITVEREHLFLTREIDSSTSYVSIEHNVDCAKRCCILGCAPECRPFEVCCPNLPANYCSSLAGCPPCGE